jgi:hypothetical protein
MVLVTAIAALADREALVRAGDCGWAIISADPVFSRRCEQENFRVGFIPHLRSAATGEPGRRGQRSEGRQGRADWLSLARPALGRRKVRGGLAEWLRRSG